MQFVSRILSRSIFLAILFSAVVVPASRGAADTKARVLFLPMAGDASEKLREDAGFALRTKLDRSKLYEIIDGFAVDDLVSTQSEPVTHDTPAEKAKELAEEADAQIVAWGDVTGSGPWTWRVKILDLRAADARTKELEMNVETKQDFRFAAEHVVEAFQGVRPHTYVPSNAVTEDDIATELWKTNPNLLLEGDFTKPDAWFTLYLKEKYNPPISTTLPDEDKVVIYRTKVAEKNNEVLAMNLSRWCAENPGMACISREIAIEPDTRYRLSFRYKSEGPVLHVFVKGYTRGKNVAGQDALREVYRRQVPPSGPTGGEWVDVIDDLNPQHVHFPVQFLKVDLYAYLTPGVVMFDDVILKAVGQQTHRAKDDAIKPPTTRNSVKPEVDDEKND